MELRVKKNSEERLRFFSEVVGSFKIKWQTHNTQNWQMLQSNTSSPFDGSFSNLLLAQLLGYNSD